MADDTTQPQSGFFLEQRVELDFLGMRIDSLELIGYDPETKTFPSTVYSNMSPRFSIMS